MNKYYDLVKAPIITELTNKLIERQNKYTFKVAKTANKVEIKKALESIFQVKFYQLTLATFYQNSKEKVNSKAILLVIKSYL
ncbi:50S ribosomal protein L23 [Areca yellow leaf disease phytoplasma]|uniref:50S ribosomal protein L23 n=1 Tax=Areca yellow leaf disease phytoplasma TaxID=927614 RepID=UPI0035B51D75